VRLHFAEIYSRAFSAGSRVFDVVIEGVEAFPDLDIYDEVGAYKALTKVGRILWRLAYKRMISLSFCLPRLPIPM